MFEDYWINFLVFKRKEVNYLATMIIYFLVKMKTILKMKINRVSRTSIKRNRGRNYSFWRKTF